MFGLKVYLTQCIKEFAGWRRVHRKKRIAKKWRKKYGPKMRCKGMCYQLRGTGLIVCPCVNGQLKARLHGEQRSEGGGS